MRTRSDALREKVLQTPVADQRGTASSVGHALAASMRAARESHPVHAEQYGEHASRAAANGEEHPGPMMSPRPGELLQHGEPDRVTTGVGEWLVQPVQYNSFRVPAVTISTSVRPGESVDSALRRAHADAVKAHVEMREKELAAYLDFLERVGAEVTRRNGR